MIVGKVLRRHAGGYLVHSPELNAVFQCPLRARLKKAGVSVVTGDLVEMEEVELPGSSDERGTAVISARHERRNLLTRPFLANIDQVFIVQSIHQPKWNALLCDRCLVHLQLELDGVRCFICINKCDLATEDELSALRKIYEPLGYKILFVSARTSEGIEEFVQAVSGHSSVLIGPSGVGKSSLINALIPGLDLKVDINDELLVGRHTTTYSELYKIPAASPKNAGSWIGDTPGFSMTELDYPEPTAVAWQFPEILPLGQDCRFSNCLHLVEEGCNVLAHLTKIAESRYESYVAIVGDAQNSAALRKDSSQKIDSGTLKNAGGSGDKTRVIPRLNERFRVSSRRKGKQYVTEYRKSGHEEFRDGEPDDEDPISEEPASDND